MESIVLAISGLSFLGVSEAIRRTAGKHVNTLRLPKLQMYEGVTTSIKRTSAAVEAESLLKQPVASLMSSESHPVLQHYEQ